MPTIAVPDQNPVNQYTATASQTVFAYSFLIFDEADIEVIQDGTTLSLGGGDYTVSGVLNESGGNITLATGATLNDLVTIRRKSTISRASQYQNSGRFEAAVLERDLDKITTILQELRRETGNAVTLNVADLTSSSELPAPAAGKALAWSSSSPYSLVNGPDTLDIANAGANATAATAKAAEAAASAAAALVSANDAAASAASILAFTTGDAKLTLKATADSGWIMADDGSIGNGASGASNRANADTEDLFTLLWDNVSDTYAPVSSGRGASAADDFAANKTITLTRTLGRSLGVAGAGASLTSRALGEYLGAETHALTEAELASHTHTATVTDGGHSHTQTYLTSGAGTGNSVSGGAFVAGQTNATNTTASATTGITVANSSTGSGTAHNIMQPTSFWNVMIKL